MPRRFDRMRPHLDAIGAALGAGERSGPLRPLVAELAEGTLTPRRHRAITGEHGIIRDPGRLDAELDLVLSLVRAMLAAGPLEADDVVNVLQLEALLELREGEFYTRRPAEVAALLEERMARSLADGELDDGEDREQAALQRIFGLSYDQYLALVRRPLADAAARLADSIGGEADPDRRAALEHRLARLQPLVRLAAAQPPALGALY